jgi:hypothetical protein
MIAPSTINASTVQCSMIVTSARVVAFDVDETLLDLSPLDPL